MPHTVQEIKSLADKAFEMYVTPLLSAFFLLAAQYNRQAESFLLHKDMETHHLPVEIDSFREIENCFGKEAVENCDKSSNSPNPKLKVFSARLESLNVASIADKILIEINLLYASLFSLWHNYTNLVTLYSSKLTAHLRELWTKELSERCKSTIFRETLCVEDRYKQVDQNAIEAKSQLMNHAKNFSPMDGVDEMSIIDTYLDSDYERLIFISEQRFNDPSKELINNTESSGVGKHLIVFLHGYQGSSWDLRTFRNYMSFLYPELIFLLSSSNECLTEGDIEEMGARFAAEVDDYMKTHLDQNITRISFIAHSLGGLILRSSLIHERMIPYRDRFFTFFSLGSPHCGYLYSSNMILNTGIWALKKWYKSKSLEQLSLTDLSDPRKCFLYRLSQFSGLQYFKHVLLASSPDDKYVPYHSARMEVPKECHKDKRYGIFYEEMVRNLLSDLDSVNLVRFDVYFRHSQLDLNSVLGRSAHISFLDHRLYILMFLTVYAEFFQ